MGERVLPTLRRWLSGSTAVDGAPGMPPETASEGTPLSREIEFSAYTEDCRVYGFLKLEAERLSNALNTREQFELSSVLLVALEDSRAVELNRLVVTRDELVAVRASGPRGNPQRRSRRRPAPVGMRAGPYLIHGYLHTPPGSDPLQEFRRRKAMVPITEAWIEYSAGGLPHRARVGTVIVNRDFVDWIDHAKDAEVRKDLPAEMRVDPRAKDMTGQIRVWWQEPLPDGS